MNPKQLLAYCGAATLFSGLGLIVSQVIWPDHFVAFQKQLHFIYGFDLTTNSVGFAVMAFGGLLLLVSSFGRPSNSN